MLVLKCINWSQASWDWSVLKRTLCHSMLSCSSIEWNRGLCFYVVVVVILCCWVVISFLIYFILVYFWLICLSYFQLQTYASNADQLVKHTVIIGCYNVTFVSLKREVVYAFVEFKSRLIFSGWHFLLFVPSTIALIFFP